MARVTPPSERKTGVRARMVFWLTGRALDRLAGRPAHPDRMVEPLRVYAHLPGVLRGYARVEQAIVALENLRGRVNLALGIEAAGFSQGRVCALPIPEPEAALHRSEGARAGLAQDRRS